MCGRELPKLYLDIDVEGRPFQLCGFTCKLAFRDAQEKYYDFTDQVKRIMKEQGHNYDC